VKKAVDETAEKPFPFVLPEDQAGPSGVTPVKKPTIKKLTPSKSGLFLIFILNLNNYKKFHREKIKQKINGSQIC